MTPTNTNKPQVNMQYSESKQGMYVSESQKALQPSPELQGKMTPLLTDMVKFLLKKKPQDPIPYMVEFLSDKMGKGYPELTMEERVELEQLREAHKQLRDKLEASGSGSKQKAAKHEEEEVKGEEAPEADGSSSDSEVSGKTHDGAPF